jgi:hypothetical protein
MFELCSIRFNARPSTSHHGQAHPIKNAEIVAGSLIGIQNAMVKSFPYQEELHAEGLLGVPRGKNPGDSNLASVKAMQCVLLYISIGHDRCY